MGDDRWQGSLTIGSGWALFVGLAGESEQHAHHAWQLCVASTGSFELSIAGAALRSVAAAAIPSGVPHAISWGPGPGALLYLEPDSPPGRALAATLGSTASAILPSTDFAPARSALSAYCSSSGPIATAVSSSLRDACLEVWLPDREVSSRTPDPRVDAVCERIRSRIGEARHPAVELARIVGLSPSRLAAIFRTQNGIALRPFILWTRLERAIAELAAGSSVTEAAYAAGFADAAHLARTFRRMFGTSVSRGLGAVDIDLVGP